MNKLLVLTLFIVSLFTSFLIVGDPNQPPTLLKEQLETKKLALEIKKLQADLEVQEQTKHESEIRYWSTIGGSLVGICALMWTILSGLRNLREQSTENRHNRISSLLERLSSDSEATRSGAARGLSQYVINTGTELLAVAYVEESEAVKKNIQETLKTLRGSYRNLVTEKNSVNISDRFHLAGRLRQAKIEDVQIQNMLRLSDSALAHLRTLHRVEYEYGQKIAKLGDARKLESKDDELDKLKERSKQLVRLQSLSKEVLAKWCRDGNFMPLSGLGLDLSEANLYDSDLSSFSGNGFLFENSLMRHCYLVSLQIYRSSFIGADMLDSNISYSVFDDVLFRNANLRSAKANNTTFNMCDMGEIQASEVNFMYAKFIDTKLAHAKLKATMFNHAVFEGAVLNRAELHSSKFIKANLTATKFMASKLIESNFEKATLVDCEFNGADLKGASFRDAKMARVSFAGANIANADFRGATIEETELNKCKGFPLAILK